MIQHVVDDPTDCTLDPSITDDGWWGGRKRETPDEAESRAIEVADRLVQCFGSSGRAIVVVIHADFKRKLLRRLIGSHTDPSALGKLRNTGITKIDFDGQRWLLDWFNSVSHLPAGLITGIES